MMQYTISTRPMMAAIALLGLLAVSGCAAKTGESSGDTRSNVNGVACAAELEDGKADKIVCSSDPDCDSDEVCLDGKCTGLDGEGEDSDACADEIETGEEETDEAEGADDADDEGGADKITCSTDADCDSDEVCVSGKCD